MKRRAPWRKVAARRTESVGSRNTTRGIPGDRLRGGGWRRAMQFPTLASRCSYRCTSLSGALINIHNVTCDLRERIRSRFAADIHLGRRATRRRNAIKNLFRRGGMWCKRSEEDISHRPLNLSPRRRSARDFTYSSGMEERKNPPRASLRRIKRTRNLGQLVASTRRR